MAKFCTNCGKELEENAAMCLNCGKLVESGNNKKDGKKKKGLPTWAIVLIVVGAVVLIPIILFVVFSFLIYRNISDATMDYIEENEVIVGTIGDTLRTDDFKITLTDALMYSSIEGQYYTDTPMDGREYLVFFFDVENISDESEYISTYNFYGYVDERKAHVEYLTNDINGAVELNVNLDVGEKVSGYVAFEVDTSWQNFEIRYFENLYGSGKTLIFNVINDESTQNQNAW